MSFNLEITSSNVFTDVKILTPEVFEESRGNIWTSFTHKEVDSLLPKGLSFKHDKFSWSRKNVLRGIHGDPNTWKLVTCVYGEIYMVVVDMRENSSTFSNYQHFIINSKNPRSILIPPSMGNGYCVISPAAVYHYKLAYKGDYTDADRQFTVAWNDPKLGINWPVDNPILSMRDQEKENAKN